MWVSIDLCVIPLGVETSLSPFVIECQKQIEKSGLEYQLGPNGTSIEGEWEAVFKCVQNCHEIIHSIGVNRIYTTLKVNTRIDKKQSFKDKLKSIENKINKTD